MSVVTYDDVDEYAHRVLPTLLSDEARHNLAVGVIRSLQTGALVPHGRPLLGAIGASSAPEAAFVHTPPWGMLLTGLPEGAAPEVVDAVVEGGWRPRSLTGPREATDPVAAEWCARTGAVVAAERDQGVYALGTLVTPRGAPGAARAAGPDDAGLVHRWFAEFTAELNLVTSMPREQLDARVAAGDVLLWWSDGAPVSMAGIGARTATGARIGPVYTPPEHRRRGYAAAATAAATQRCLDEGARWCFLYTDLDNPTSNAVYRRLGYRMVCESREITFASP